MSPTRATAILLILFAALGLVYAVTTPIFEASDELWHYPLVRHLADGNPLPVQDPNNVGPWRQEASQQPLYYALAAALTFWVDTSDMETVRWLNPHVDNGVLTPDGNINLIVHRPGAERFPWHGTVLAVRLVRFLSVLMGVGTVYFTWRIAQLVFPARPELALGAAAVNAFTPMFLFISGAVNNDNLAILLASAALFLMIRPLASRHEPTWRDSLLLGIVLGLAAVTKTSTLGLIPLAFLALLIAPRPHLRQAAWRDRIWRLLLDGLLIVVPVVLIAGWWYLRNIRLYGDWLGWDAFLQVLGQRGRPASLRQLWGERWGFSLSYWGLFGGVNVAMPEWIYRLLNGIAVLSAAGLVVYLVRAVRLALSSTPDSPAAARLKTYLTSLTAQLGPIALVLGWTGATVVGLIRWATVTWSSQGRLVFSAISAISILLVAGLLGWLPYRAGRPWRAQLSVWGVAVLVGGMFLLSALAPFLWIAPAYRLPGEPATAPQHKVDLVYGASLRLMGYDLASDTVEPGGQVDLTLYWEVIAPVARDWSVFVHLNDPTLGAPIAQRDRYPGQGLLATSLLEPGQRFADRAVVAVPGTVYAPVSTDLVVGLYDFQTRERLLTNQGQDAATLTQVALKVGVGGPYPNPMRYNFGDQLALVGYSCEPRRLEPGDTLILTLYWQALTDMERDYTVFAHLRDLEDPSTRLYAAQDAQPMTETGGTSTWPAGRVVESLLRLELDADTPPAVHEIEVGVYYWDSDHSLQRLQLVTPDGRLVDDFLILGQVRVD